MSKVTRLKVLVTGAQGFIGSHLAQYFQDSADIEIVPYNSKSKGEIASGCLNAEPCDVVVHLASKVFIPESWEKPNEYYQTNVMGTIGALEYCRKNKARMIYFSSIVYSQPFQNPISEDHTLGATNPYSYSKLAAENSCQFYADQFGVPVTILRPFNIYGPGQKQSFLIPKIIQQALNPDSDVIELQTLSPRRDYLYVEDLCSLLEKILLHPQSGKFNVASGKSHSVQDVVDTVQKVLGSKKSVVATGIVRKDDPIEIVGDIKKVKTTFHWEPRFSLEMGLTKIVEDIKTPVIKSGAEGSELLSLIQSLYPNRDVIALHEPVFRGNEEKYLLDCLKTTLVSTIGPYVSEFEKHIANFTGSKFAIATMNGTSALHMALMLAGVERDDEVLTQGLTFVATANAISYCHAKPVFLDSDLSNLGLSLSALQIFLQENTEVRDNGFCYNKMTNRRIKACVPMHVFGHAVEIDAIAEICAKNNIELVEDAAEALGSYYKGRHLGTFGKIGIFSFNGNKIVTTGGGGMIITDDPALAKLAKHLTTTAKVPHSWNFSHDQVGYNYRLPNINAALGCAQMEKLGEFIRNKQETAAVYREFCLKKGFNFIDEPVHCRSNFWLCSLRLPDKASLEEFLEKANAQKIMARPLWNLMSELPAFKGCQNDGLKNAKYLRDRVVSLPSGVR